MMRLVLEQSPGVARQAEKAGKSKAGPSRGIKHCDQGSKDGSREDGDEKPAVQPSNQNPKNAKAQKRTRPRTYFFHNPTYNRNSRP